MSTHRFFKWAWLILFFTSSLHAQEKGLSPSFRDSSPESGQTYAVVVGISDYQDERIPDLHFAHRDAAAFAQFLRSPAGGALDEDHLKVLLNEQATAAQFAMQLDWLWEVAGEQDRVIIYFSGHGDVERKSITQPGYLLCWDAPGQVYMAGGALNVRDLNDVISTLSVQNKAKVVLITDACRAGKLSGSAIGGSQATAAHLAKQYGNEVKILSCQPDEYSMEGMQWGGGHGAFSYHLIEGLYGLADGNVDLWIDLKEISRYLEDHVTREVAPAQQNPMTVGNKRELLTRVDPELLGQMKEGDKERIRLFTAVESRSMEEEVLAGLHDSLVQTYQAFKRAIKEKRFLFPDDDCAEAYFQKLIQEPSLNRMYSTMRRNYAAALQDEAQQEMNTMLHSGLTKQILKGVGPSVLYQNYPAYLERAAELLGETHYMYKPLKARKYFFEGRLRKKRNERPPYFWKALELQPEMPLAMVELIRCAEADQLDTAMYYFQKSKDLIPSWVEPYLAMSSFYIFRLGQFDKAEELLDMAGQVDSTSVVVWYNKAILYKDHDQFDQAEYWFLKTIRSSGNGICFPCAYNSLGVLYNKTSLLKEGEEILKQGLRIDSTYWMFHANLAITYQKRRDWELCKKACLKAMEYGPDIGRLHCILGDAQMHLSGQLKEAKSSLDRAVVLTPDDPDVYVCLAKWALKKGRHEQAWVYFQQGLEKGIGNGILSIQDVQDDPDFMELRKESRWEELLREFFPEGLR